MNRRHFISLFAGLTLLPLSLQALAWDYTPGMLEARLAKGETVLVDYHAPWCGTCATQKRVIAKLRSKNPQYDEKITFVRVDWDEYGTHAVTTSRNVPRRSTLLMLRGDKELGRVVAGISEEEIKALLDTAL